MGAERARNYNQSYDQTASDEELFDAAKINQNKLDKEKLKNIVDGIVNFAEIISDTKFYKYQKEFGQRIVWSLVVEDGETITGQFARQGGKSHVVAGIADACTIMFPLIAEYMDDLGIDSSILKFRRGFWTGVYGPDYDRAAIVGKRTNTFLTLPKTKKILTSPKIGMDFPERLSVYTGNLPRNSFINVKSANRRVSIEGDTYHLVITDETQEISDYVLKKSIHPMLSATLGTLVHIGSPYLEKVYFYDIIKQNKRDDINKPHSRGNHYEADYKTVQKYNPRYKKYIQGQKRTLGEYSDEFRMSYELYWPLEQGMFITEDFLISHLAKNYNVASYDVYNDHCVGIDIAKHRDSTVITVGEVDWDNPIVIDPDSNIKRRKKKIKNWLEIQGDDYDSQFYQICDFLDNYKWLVMAVDSTGVGEPIADRLENKYRPQGKIIKRVVYNKQSKSEIYGLLSREMLAERIIFPNSENVRRYRKHKKFKEQMINLSKQIEGGYLVVEHTSDTGHDDYPDSLALFNWAVESDTELGDVEEIGENILLNNPNEKNFWKIAE